MAGDTQFLVMGSPNSFMVDNADFRHSPEQDYLEARMGARLVLSDPPKTVGAATWEPTTVQPAQATECAGGPTVCTAGWYGCGPLACEANGTIIGVCCGGWTGATAPK